MLFAPLAERGPLLSKGQQGSRYLAVYIDEVAIKVCKTKEALDPSYRGGCFLVPDSPQLLWVYASTYSSFNDEPKVFRFRNRELVLVDIEVKACRFKGA